MEINLAGRSAIVTGGSKGIGFGVATRFAQSGADVAIVARGREALDAAARSIGTASAARVIAVVADVASPADISRAYDEIMRAFGKVDIIVNNAGTSRAGPFENLTDELMQQDLDQKFFAALRLTRLVWPQMKERRWGRVINVLNIGAKAPRGGSAPTTISRAAGMALTKVLAGEGAPHNILVDALLVGILGADQHVQACEAHRGTFGRVLWSVSPRKLRSVDRRQSRRSSPIFLLARLRRGILCHGTAISSTAAARPWYRDGPLAFAQSSRRRVQAGCRREDTMAEVAIDPGAATPPQLRQPWYAVLYIQVLITIALGVAIGRFYPNWASSSTHSAMPSSR